MLSPFFPSIMSKNTGIIVRKMVIKSPLRFDGFDYKQGLRYIVINKHLTGDLQVLANVLPWRRKVGGVAMTVKGINAKEDDPELQWTFPGRQPTEIQKREIIGRVAEIGLRVVF